MGTGTPRRHSAGAWKQPLLLKPCVLAALALDTCRGVQTADFGMGSLPSGSEAAAALSTNTAPLRPMQQVHRLQHHRRLQQSSASSANLFATLPPCRALQKHVGNLQPANNPLGPGTNFTSRPDLDAVARCPGYLFPETPVQMVLAIEQPAPAIKLIRLLQSRTGHYDYPSDAVRAARHSVTVIDCSGQWMNMLLLKSYPEVQATVMWFNCRLIFPDMATAIAQQSWSVNTSNHFPCNVCLYLCCCEFMMRCVQSIWQLSACRSIGPIA